ncbi:hypothetical protein BKA56DRAFT_616465 [Ilyonectria sp. MPI-CAGE-AT-0026]|nr:hypothetical protein BKA56DRAFT_616465 [Ilyonectria sp. MPI-CAGE-AT-0026]
MHSRHILLGYFNTSFAVCFSVFLFFPKTTPAARRRKISTAANGLSRERQEDLYNKIIIPAVHEAIPTWRGHPAVALALDATLGESAQPEPPRASHTCEPQGSARSDLLPFLPPPGRGHISNQAKGYTQLQPRLSAHTRARHSPC